MKTYLICRADVPNLNKRIYSKALLEAEVLRLRPQIEASRFMGEMGAPESAVVKLTNVSHIITALRMEGTDLMASVEPLDTLMGQTLKKLLAINAVSFRMSGMGNITRNSEGFYVVGDNYKMIQVFACCNPA